MATNTMTVLSNTYTFGKAPKVVQAEVHRITKVWGTNLDHPNQVPDAVIHRALSLAERWGRRS